MANSKCEEPISVGGKYWTAYFRKDSKDPSVGNFMLFGIMPVELNPDHTVTGKLYTHAIWEWDGNVEVVFDLKQSAQLGGASEPGESSQRIAFTASDGGDVLTANLPVDFGMSDNRIRLLRDNHKLRKQYLGRYVFVSQDGIGDAERQLELRDRSYSGLGDGTEWLAAGEYVILIGAYDPMYYWPSFVLRCEDGGQTLRFVPSDPEEELDVAQWVFEYRKL